MEDNDNNGSDALRFINSETRCLSFYAENGFPDDYRIFQECLEEEGHLRFGQWDYLTVLAWVGSRNQAFTAGVQRFCNQPSISPYRGGPFWGANRLLIASAMSKATWSASYDEAVADLREALEGERLKGTALREKDGARATISGDEWRAGFGEVSHYNSFSLVEGYRDHLWLSHDVVVAFPAFNQVAPSPSSMDSTPSLDQEALRIRREAWAKDAASRGVTITNARKDALRCLGEQHAPQQDEARAILRIARAAIDNPVRRGRPEGSKSYAKQD